MRLDLPDGYFDLPAGKLANVVTCLQMLHRPPTRAGRVPDDGTTIVRVERPPLPWYRELFREVGGPYLWSSRLALDDAHLSAIVDDAGVEIWVPRFSDGGDAGLLELDFREHGQCELRFFGLVKRAIGRGIGRRLMERAIERAWARPIERFWVHTCTLDDPKAVAFYRRSGFEPYLRQIEIYDDPRLVGLLPPDVAPDVPVL
ncbi:MAG TPA: GNAT family N-acetyltransferase [Candidatus Acidoferrales bacterium]|nr:GNAT family N-acetyltransferase [Candidatus Acidoferrales bacterium]